MRDVLESDLLEYYTKAPLLELGLEADRIRAAKHPHGVVTYIVDRNINYTNVCVADCGFCAFYRRPKDGEGWTLSFEQIGGKIDETKALGGVQILIQGGHNPYIPFEWYLELLKLHQAAPPDPHPWLLTQRGGFLRLPFPHGRA